MHPVCIEKIGGRDEAFEATIRVLEKTGFADLLPAGNILVKPNLVTDASASEGITTDPVVVDALLHFIIDVNSIERENIKIGEGCGAGPTRITFSKNGYDDLAKKWGVELLDLDTSEGLEVEVPAHRSVKKLRIAKAALDADLRISVAKLKVHSIGIVTGCLKNMMGCLNGKRWKLVVHGDVQKRIVDLNRLVKPHFGLVDGIVGNEVEECDPNPVPMNILIGGRDVVAVDAVCAECMGVRWSEVPYLQMAEEEGMGTANIENIGLVGESVENVRRNFSRKSGLWTYVRTRSEVVAGRIWEKLRK